MPVEILQLADAREHAKTNTFGRALLRACNAVLEGDMRLDNHMLEDEFATALASWHTVRRLRRHLLWHCLPWLLRLQLALQRWRTTTSLLFPPPPPSPSPSLPLPSPS